VLVRPSMVTAAVSPTGELPQFLVADGLRVALSDVGCASTSLPLRDLKKRPNYSRYLSIICLSAEIAEGASRMLWLFLPGIMRAFEP
jgi:hypothetical protein